MMMIMMIAADAVVVVCRADSRWFGGDDGDCTALRRGRKTPFVGKEYIFGEPASRGAFEFSCLLVCVCVCVSLLTPANRKISKTLDDICRSGETNRRKFVRFERRSARSIEVSVATFLVSPGNKRCQKRNSRTLSRVMIRDGNERQRSACECFERERVRCQWRAHQNTRQIATRHPNLTDFRAPRRSLSCVTAF
jgi:hypothetical protein